MTIGLTNLVSLNFLKETIMDIGRFFALALLVFGLGCTSGLEPCSLECKEGCACKCSDGVCQCSCGTHCGDPNCVCKGLTH